MKHRRHGRAGERELAEAARALEIRHLRTFIVVADELHFGRAAERLGVAQPPLSQQVQRIERLVGHALFERRPVVRLTPAGAALLPVAYDVVRVLEQGLRTVARAGRGESGTVAIGFASSTLLGPVPALLHRFRRRHPGVSLRLTEWASAEQARALLDGSIDVGFSREPLPEPAGLESATVMEEPFVVALSPRHALAARRRVAVRALADQPFIHFPRDVAPALHDQVLALCAAAGFAPTIELVAREWITIVGLVEAGEGVAIVPACFRRLRWGSVVYRPIDAAGFTTTVRMCWRAEALGPAAGRFVGEAVAGLRGE